MANDIYTPDTISDQPLPVLEYETGSQTTGSGVMSDTKKDGVLTSPATIPPRPPPNIPIARKVINETLNTDSRQILGQYTFGQVGALQVGTYENGVSGDIRISPNGITGRNVNGETTFSIDGTTGNATFKGTLQAGTVIAGDSNVLIGGSASGGHIIVYVSGIPTILIGVI
jgi:hypothetical protein